MFSDEVKPGRYAWFESADMHETIREEPRIGKFIARPWTAATHAADQLESSLGDVMHGKPLTPGLMGAIDARHAQLLRTTRTYVSALLDSIHGLLNIRLALLDRSDRILTSFGFAGGALLLGVSILVGRSVSRRHRRELARAQRDAEQLSAELARQRAERALLLTEAQFRAVFERSQMGIALLARDGSTIESNGSLRTLLGDGMTVLISRDDPEFVALVEGRHGTYHSERNIQRADGTRIWVEITVSPVDRSATRGNGGDRDRPGHYRTQSRRRASTLRRLTRRSDGFARIVRSSSGN